MIRISSDLSAPFRPLGKIEIDCPAAATIRVLDGAGREYAVLDGPGPLRVSGALGMHTVLALDADGRLLDTASFAVDCDTELDDEGGPWSRLMFMLRWNMFKGREFKIVRYQGRPWMLFSDWLRDHVHILKGKKYFFPQLKDAIELFGGTQQDDGMLYDFLMPHEPQAQGTGDRFHERRFVEVVEGSRYFFERVPVEADVEYLYVEGLHYTWKATGDTGWMLEWLHTAEKAMRYCLESPLRWSEKYGLIKRGYTIDTWDFQTDTDSAVTGDTMDVVPGRTEFGIMHGDNTGFAASCGYLAEMLEAAGRPDDARAWRAKGREILDRLVELTWRDGYFRHWLPETEGLRRESNGREERQVSLSNTYALNRGIDEEHARAIIGTYQRIRDEMPESAPGEFYSIYPPFAEAFRHHLLPWHYVNGGVFPFIAGELAHGAFQHGAEAYGVDVLRRVADLLDEHDGEFPYYWLGRIEPAPERTFHAVDLSAQANVDVCGENDTGVTAWTGEGPDNDLSAMPTGHNEWHGIPFEVIDPAANGRRACIGLAAADGYKMEASVPVGSTAASLYFLHCTAGNGSPVGWVTLRYADGSERRVYVESGRQVKNWWSPTDVPYNRRTGWTCRVAWSGRNTRTHVGTFVWGLNNPEPDLEIAEVAFTHSGTGHKWFVIGLTLSDAPVYFEPPTAHGEWLVNWNSAGVVYALIEGLAGIVDEGVAYDRVRLSPRWAAAGVKTVTACAKYEASGAYVRYRYEQDPDALTLELAGNGDSTALELLLPDGFEPGRALVDGREIDFSLRTHEGSRYACIEVPGLGARTVTVERGQGR